MSKLAFQAVVDLKSAIQGDGNWDITVEFRDGEGLFTGSSLTVGDVIVFNTGLIEPGTFTRYAITNVGNVSWTGSVDLTVEYDPTNNNDSPDPPLDWLSGATGIVARPSEHLGLLPVPSPQIQGLPDSFSFHTLNDNMVHKLDAPRSDGSGKMVLFTGEYLPLNPMDGRAELPHPPLGDFVFNMGLAYLVDGSVVEVVGLSPFYDETAEKWFAVVPEADLIEMGYMIGAVTVTYLIESE